MPLHHQPKQTPVKKDRYLHRFDITGESGTNYRISFDTAQMCWCCACRGCCRYGSCKHLIACGLKGRKFGRQDSIPTAAPQVAGYLT